ncbi:MAG: putative ABC exporter domain-containing protein [Acidobacteriota bacterium]
MSSRSDSSASVFLFVYLRTTRNSLRRLARRLSQPRYAIGFALGVIYFCWTFSRMRFGVPHPGATASLSPQALALALQFSSAAFAAVILMSWVLRRSKPDLALSEAEAQFFFSAPLSSRAVVHYALIRSQATLLLSSLVVAVFFRRGNPAQRVQTLLGAWILLSTLRLHWLGISFARASWSERGRTMRAWLATGAAIGLLALLFWTFVDAATAAFGWLTSHQGFSAEELQGAVSSGRLAGVARLILSPSRAVLAPLFAPTFAAFLFPLAIAAAVLAAHYFWVFHAAAGYEEATLEGAVRRAERRQRRLAGRTRTVTASRRSRAAVPFALDSRGRPEVAIVWKNLISWSRIRLTRFGKGVLVVCALLFVLLRQFSAVVPAATGIAAAITIMFVCAVIAIMLPVAPRYDLRQDLDNLDVLRSWPLSPVRLVAAELATPWLLSVGFLLLGLALSSAIVAGSLARQTLPAAGAAGETLVRIAIPLAIAALFVIPAVSAFVVIVQNSLTLSFPAWFHQKERRVTQLERSGSAMLSMLVTFLVLALAALPCALLGGLLWLILGGILGIWIVPIAAVFSSALLWGGIVLAVKALARLYEGLDPSLDLGA